MIDPVLEALLAKRDAIEGVLSRIDVYLLIFGVFVVVGVGGESFFGFWAWRSNRKLHTVQRDIEQSLQSQIARADQQSAEARKEAAELTTKNLQLEAAIAPRRLSERQLKGLATLTAFNNRTVAIKSYANDTEGLVLATQIVDSLSKSKIHIQDNRLTMQSAGSVSFGVLVDGSDKALVEKLNQILSLDGDLSGSSVSLKSNLGISTNIQFGVISGGPLAATITVGMKPIK
jgi:hypothetical protein